MQEISAYIIDIFLYDLDTAQKRIDDYVIFLVEEFIDHPTSNIDPEWHKNVKWFSAIFLEFGSTIDVNFALGEQLSILICQDKEICPIDFDEIAIEIDIIVIWIPVNFLTFFD